MQSSPQNAASSGPFPGRRSFVRWMAGLMSAVAGLILGFPLVSYFFGQRKRAVHWITVGAIADFPVEETRVVEFDNPLSQKWDGVAAHTGVFVRKTRGTES